jgi:hypothetical protein
VVVVRESERQRFRAEAVANQLAKGMFVYSTRNRLQALNKPDVKKHFMD